MSSLVPGSVAFPTKYLTMRHQCGLGVLWCEMERGCQRLSNTYFSQVKSPIHCFADTVE